MKLKVINFDSKNVFGSIKQAVFTSALSYAKMYELLHKQIWRKARYRLTIEVPSSLAYFNNRPVGFVRKWDIASASKSPYSYSGGDHTFGLNQLFVGQDYRKEYSGDPKDGIYHDDCYITLVAQTTSAVACGFRNMWCASIDNDGNIDTIWSTFREDMQGNVVVSNMVVEYYTVEKISYTRLILTNSDGTTQTVELGADVSVDIYLISCDGQSNINAQAYSTWNNTAAAFPEHGSVVQQYSLAPVWYSSSNPDYSAQSTVTVFEDGTVIEYTPAHRIPTHNVTKKVDAKYTVLPMIYLDTGDLAMNRVEFVDKWDEYFELFVHEDSEWWTGLVKPIAVIVVAIITYYSCGATSGLMAAVIAIGGTLTIVGILTNNTELMLIGGILMAFGSIYTAVAEMAATSATSATTLSTMSTEQALASTSFSETFSGYASAAGMENLLVMPTVESYTSLTLDGLVATSAPYAQLATSAGMSVADYVSLSGANAFSIDSLFSMGKEIYSVYSNTDQLLKGSSATSSSSASTSDNSGVRISISNSDEEDDVMQYIKKVIEI